MSGLVAKMGRQTLRIGSASSCELRTPGEVGTAALLIHQGDGKLVLLPEIEGLVSREGRPLPAGQPVPFDFRAHFQVAGLSLGPSCDDACLMVMAQGELPPSPGVLVLGRDPTQCHLVLVSPGVSARHATLDLRHMTLVDHGSTSGTTVDGARIPAGVTTTVARQAVIFCGPLPLPLDLALRYQEELNVPIAPAPAGFGEPSTAQPLAPGPPSFLQPPAPSRHSTVMGTIRMEAARSYGIGRRSDNDIVLDHPQISSTHARLLRIGRQLYLEDAGSELGTFVRGTRLRPRQKARVDEGEEIRLGPVTALLRLSGDAVDVVLEDRVDWAGKPLFEVEAQDVSVVVVDRDDPRTTKTLLDGVSFKALPGDLIALMGPSGSGKTTLLHALTGSVRRASGQILVNGQPLEGVFDSLRGSIGYVPQDDIIHPELTVLEAVRYSAQFRLPSDYTQQEIDARVHTTLARLGLESVSHLQIGKPEQKVLSGGQRKRVNIAMELVTDPVILFLDEPTSGLAADDTTTLVELLARLAREQGKTIIATIHQPAKDEYEKFNLALVLGHGGCQMFFGKTVDAYSFFEGWRAPRERQRITNPRDMFAELAEREARIGEDMAGASRLEIRQRCAQAFRLDYENSPLKKSMLSGARALASQSRELTPASQRRRPKRQLSFLVRRYLRIKGRDRVGTAILMLQAPLIGVLLALVFGAQEKSVPYWCLGALSELAERSQTIGQGVEGVLGSMTPTRDNAGALFFLVISAVWFGTSNAAREIVSERAIYRRERMINLQIKNYILSKFLVLGGLCVAQCSILLGIVYFALDLAGGPATFASSLGIMIATALCSIALGLLLSALVASSEAAMALTPIALIPQVVLGGLLVPITTNRYLGWAMQLVPARFGFEGVVRGERALVAREPAWSIQLSGAIESRPDYIYEGKFHCALAQLESPELTGAWGFGAGGSTLTPGLVLGGMTLLLLVAVSTLLKRRG